MKTTEGNSNVLFLYTLKELIDGCKKGDHKAQLQIYKIYYKSMYNISLSIVKNCEEAEDIMQESLLSALEKIENYSGTESFEAWLNKIVQNRSLDILRKRMK